jgi:hypothetical protein
MLELGEEMAYRYTTQTQVRKAFKALHPDLDYHKIPNYSGNGVMYKTDTRCAFADFVDYLSKNGDISQELALVVTL